MLKLVIYRVLAAIPIILGLTLLVFLLTKLSPIDPVTVALGEHATESAKAAVRAQLGLDQPWLVQYFNWLVSAAQGSFGKSIFTNLPVTQMIQDRVQVTLSLSLLSTVFSLFAGIPLGMISARFQGRWLDRALGVITSIGLSIPSFWLGILLALLFGVVLRLFPVIGYTPIEDDPVAWFVGLVLPVIAMSVYPAGVIARQTRGSMVDALNSNYARALRARGLGATKITNGYALRNALVPVLAVIGIQLSHLIGASFVIEQVFGMVGLGTLLIDSVMRNDFAILQAVTLVVVLLVLVINILIDIVHGYIDPKARLV